MYEIFTKNEKVIYTNGRLNNTVNESNIYIEFDNEITIKFNEFVRVIYNSNSVSVSLKNECDKIRKSKSLKNKSKFINENMDLFLSEYTKN